MQLVEDDPLQPLEERTRLAMGEKQRKLLGRGQKDVGGPLDLPGTLVAGRIAGPRLDPDRQFHLPDGRLEIAGNVDRERLQGRDVEGVEAIASGLPFGQLRKLDKARQEAGERLSRAGRRDEEDGTSARPPFPARRSGARAASSRGFRTSGGNARAVEPLTLSARPEDRT